jgi:hypothetical protein
MVATYQHEPLPLSQARPLFRLLTIHRGGNAEPLRGQLRSVAIPSPYGINVYRDRVYYEALSYVWGTDVADCEILIDGRPLAVHRNLYEFLLQWRRSGLSGHLWIDAICIDQSDLAERASQVRHMPQIYREAARVIVWLGPGGAGTGAAIELLDRASYADHESLLDHYDARDLQEFDRHPYWRRTWVVQEFCLARNYIIMWGGLSIAGATLDRLRLEVTRALDLKTGTAVSARYRFEWRHFGQGLFRAMQQRSNFSKQDRAGLLDLICAHRFTLCRYPQDRVYAMLGLTKTKIAEQIQIDYTQTMESLLVHVLTASGVASTELARWIRVLSMPLDIKSKHVTASATSLLSKSQTDASFSKALVTDPDSSKSGPQSIDNGSQPTDQDAATGVPKLMKMTAFVTGRVRSVTALEGRKPSSVAASSEYHSPKSCFPLLDGIHMPSLMLPNFPLTRRHLLAESAVNARPVASIVAVDPDLISWSPSGPLHGVALGNPKAGDLIAHFLGHETALTVDFEAHKLGKPCITGRLRCPRESLTVTQDPTTSVFRPQYEWFPFSGNDCRSPSTGVQQQVSFWLTPAEVLHLGCDPKVRGGGR